MVVLAEGEVVADGPARDVLAGSPRSRRRSPRSCTRCRLLTVAEVTAALERRREPGVPGSRALQQRVDPLRTRWQAVVALALVTLVGVVAFGWPFLAGPEVGLAHGHDAPLFFALLTGLMAR